MIYARAANGVIGRDGAIPWHLPADLKRFKALTMGHAMIMGRKTFDSFPSPLPGRRHIVLTRARNWQAEGAQVVHSKAEALALAGKAPVAIIGGAEIYRLFETDAARIEVTQLHADYDGDTFMDPPSESWREVTREDHAATDMLPAFSYITYERR
ncbi:dihydrofolate reductase [Erythrobacter sp. SDW2]|uniref:dihydrofolate reductase n=1 Tax=Erythrobacter sp. SDW2 TaxID=2907154 RepID=UPI001F445231|nr:dihydrofolate reductase [Erythrobacter sp. SDW2]UIP07412.1 dihydrofolate reductase [Erythrobacter sp. SDW2]